MFQLQQLKISFENLASDAWAKIRKLLPIWGFPAILISLGLIFLVIQVAVTAGGASKPAKAYKPEWNRTVNEAAGDTEQAVQAAAPPAALSSASSSAVLTIPTTTPVQGSTAVDSVASLSPGSAVPGPNAVFVFKCYGRAHGVGMCMDGVHYRAEAGQDYHQILNYYYTGITLSKIDDSMPVKVKGHDGAVRTMSMHDYLMKLQEEPNDSPMEELKCLYVAARTYVLSCRVRNKHQGYDVCSSGDCCQAFDENKSVANYPNNNAAVEATAGEIMTSEGQPIIAAYCGSCGGHTDNNEDVWGGSPISYLRGKPDSYCAQSPRFVATKEISTGDLSGRVGVGELKLVDLSDRTPGGRVRTAKFVGSSGTKNMTGKALAEMFGFRTPRIEYSFR